MELLGIIKQKPTEYVRCPGGESRHSVAQKYEISPTQTPCSVTCTVKIIKITAIVLTITKTVTSSIITVCINKEKMVSWNLEIYDISDVMKIYVISDVLTPDINTRFTFSAAEGQG
jgi:hypothetical protein